MQTYSEDQEHWVVCSYSVGWLGSVSVRSGLDNLGVILQMVESKELMSFCDLDPSLQEMLRMSVGCWLGLLAVRVWL